MLFAPLVLLRRPRTPIISGKGSHILRGALAIGLAVMFLFGTFSSTSSAEQLSNPTGSEFNYFILYQGPDGDLVCRGATLAEEGELDRVEPSTQSLRPINHLESDRYAHRRARRTSAAAVAAPNLTIILRGTTQLDASPEAKNAFIKAAQNWETLIKSPITIYIDVDYGSTNFGQPWGASVLASTGTPDQSYPYQSVRFNLLAEAAGEGNATKQAIYNALPATTVPTDLGNSSSTSVTNSIARAIGLLPATAQSTDAAARIAFNSARAYDFDPSDGIASGQFDFDAVATHEIGHALGFISDAGISATVPRMAVWDLFRFRTGTTSGTFTNAQRIVTIGGSPDPLQFYFVPGISELGLSTGGPAGVSTNGGDGRQSSHWKFVSSCGGAIGIMDPAISNTCRRTIGLNDQVAVANLGYNLTNNNAPPGPPPPPPAPANDNFANAQVLSGCTGSVTGTNVSATKETGEQSPESPQSTRTVWYQWQAPSTGSVTVDTVGSDFDTVLAVYTGTTVNGLTLLGSNDDNEDPNTTEHETSSQVIFSATQGTIYRIQVNGFNNGGSLGDVGSIKLNWTEANCSTQTPTIQLSASSYSVGEGAGSASINVTRSDSSGAATVDYRTTDTDNFTVGCADKVNNNGSAYGRCDFATVVSTLSFAAGESSKNFLVPIIDDSWDENDETFTIQLLNPTGATLGSPSSATVTIQDNDSADGSNPNFTTPFFVRLHYLDFLGREPEAGEPWTGILNGCGNVNNTDPNSPSAQCDRLFVSGSFFGSPEFKFKGGYVIGFYLASLNRRPLYSEFVVDLASVSAATAAEVFVKRAAFADAFVLRTEFANQYGGLSNTNYVNTLMGHYSLSSITTPDPAAPDGAAKVTLTSAQLIAGLDNSSLTKAKVLRAIVQSDQASAIEALTVFVSSQYYGYLRRTPDQSGFNDWINYLNAHPNDFRTMVNGFVNSTEYRLRFGPP